VSVHRPRKRFGQHFLHDPGVIARIVDASAPKPGEALVEIGPGEGVLTGPLIERGAALQAIEIDRDLAARLRERFGGSLVVHCMDVLDFDFNTLAAGTRIAGNLPYNISTPILFHLAGAATRLGDMHFMLQREVVERMVAAHSTPAYGRLSVMLQLRYRMRMLFRVGAGAFTPPPEVESAVVRLEPIPQAERPRVDEKLLYEVVARAFSARRKNLRNALKLDEHALAALGLEPKLRPENLAPADYVRVANFLSAPG
jgi:16S rRNA (adenine1518-N6/adenine1519-N6)-dimethyltransferase